MMLVSHLRPVILLLLLSLGGCLALPQVGFMLGRIALTSMGVEDVRIGNYHFDPGLEQIDELTLLSSGLALAGLPVNFDLPLALALPTSAPAIQLQGFSWSLEVPGAEPTQGEITEPIALAGGDTATVTLPVSLTPEVTGARETRVSALLALARQLSGDAALPAGSRLAFTPRLPAEIARLVSAPTLHFDVGERSSANGSDVPTDSDAPSDAEDLHDSDAPDDDRALNLRRQPDDV
ncbi:LEA type 2 family protein [Salinicola halophilus]|uniref:LEA type 2 family protein n=1 Tax=Salinicola halophilus TaxID=184065 RepID=UPI000DA1155F|nr:LEA type 2 family protein [Salinicola halophilus]